MHPLSPLTAAALGAMQGATEFLPVSSSGHVAIVAWLFGIEDLPLSMVIAVHAGTLISTLVVLGPEIWRIGQGLVRGLAEPREFAKTEEGRVFLGVVLGSVPTAVIGLLLKDHVEAAGHIRAYVGFGLLVSAAVVAVTRRATGNKLVLPLWGYVLIGIAQGIAIFPGITRSGTTIACGMALGLSGPAAFRFSFLLSLPAVLGAVLLEFLGGDGAAQVATPHLIAGGVAMVVGVGALLLLRGIVNSGKFWWFAIYLLPVGITLVLW